MYRLLSILFLLSVFLFTSCGNRRGLVVGKIQKASKLATTEFTIDKLVHGTKTKKIFWFIKLNEARIIVYSQAIIKTGIDLKKLKKDDIKIDEDENSIEITLPPIEVINFSYPPDKFRIDSALSDPDKFLNEINLYDQEKYFRDAEIDIRNNLEYIGIVETTQEKTRALLYGLLLNLGFEEIHIGFKNNELIVDKITIEKEDG